MMSEDTFVEQVKTVMTNAANASYALPMENYMKNHFKYLGIKSGLRRQLSKPFISASKSFEMAQLERLTDIFWDMPHREFQYFALEMLQTNRKKLNNGLKTRIEFFAQSKAWWDSIDLIASDFAGFGYKNGLITKDDIYGWNSSDNIWLIRISIIFQLKYYRETDWELLQTLILPHFDHKDFFIKKAIGWALRQYSKTHAIRVKEFVSFYPLSTLSSREALKIINK